MSHEQPAAESGMSNEEREKAITLSEELHSVQEAHKTKPNPETAKRIEQLNKELQNTGHNNDKLHPKKIEATQVAHGEEKKTSKLGMFAKGSAIVGGTFVGGFFAGVWGLFKLYGEALFGDVMPKGGGGGKKSSGGGHGGGGHGGGGHH